MSGITIDDVLKALGLAGAAIAWLYQIKAKLVREKIKTDLEILEKSKALFGDSDDRTRRIEVKVTLLMAYLYRHNTPRTPRFISWPDLTLALACLGGSIAFLLSGMKSTGYWELSLAGGLSFIGIGGLLNAFGKGRGGR